MSRIDRIDAAYAALSDAGYVMELLEECENKRMFRIYFVTCITLLRTIGQVLINKNSIGDEDDDEASKLRRIVLEVFTLIQENPDDNKIYFDFIKKERDLVIHEYEINLGFDDWNIVYSNSEEHSLFSLEDLYHPLANQAFDGEDVRDLLAKSIDWWKGQFSMIEERLNHN